MLYNAFLSYSRTADAKLAPALRSALHQFARPWYRLRALRIFCDNTSLSANPSLWASIETALQESEYFVLLASSNAAQSHWVEREAGWWLRNRSAEKMLILLTDGELIWDDSSSDFDWTRTNALPQSLEGCFRDEPLYVDLRWTKVAQDLSLRHAQFRSSVLDIAAPLHGKPKDELDGEDVRQHRRFKIAAWTAGILLLILTGVSFVTAYVATKNARIAEERRMQALAAQKESETQRINADRQRKEAEAAREAETNARLQAEQQRNIAVARQLVAEADLMRSNRLETSALLAIESIRRLPVLDNDQALRKALEILPKPGAVLKHGRGVNAVVFSSDGRCVATGGEDKTARVFEAATGAEIATFLSDGPINTVVFSPDSRYLATASKDGTARLFDVATRKEVARLIHKGEVHVVTFSPDGRYLASGSSDHTARVLEVSSRKEVARLVHGGSVYAIAFNSDSRHLSTASSDNTQRLFEIDDPREVSHLSHEFGVTATLSRDGTLAAAVSGETIRVLAIDTGREVAHFECPFDVNALDFSPDGRRLVSASAGEDNMARIFDIGTGKETADLPHQGEVDVVAFSSDNHWVITGSKDHEARVFDADSGTEVARSVHEGDVESVAFSSNGQWVAVATEDRFTRVFEARNPNEVAHLSVAAAVAAFSPDGRLVAIADGNKTARVFEVTNSKEFPPMPHTAAVDALAFSGSGRWLVTGTAGEKENSARIFDAISGKEMLHVRYDGEVLSVAFSPDDRYLATGGADHRLRIFAINDGLIYPLTTQNVATAIRALAFNRDGSELITGSFDEGGAHIFGKGKEIAFFPHRDTVLSLAFSSDGRWVATGSIDKTARIFEVATAKEVKDLPDMGPILAVAFSPDSHLLAVGNYGQSARVFEVPTGKEVARLGSAVNVDALRFIENGHILETASVFSNSTSIQRHPLYAEDLIKRVCSRLTRNLTHQEWDRYLGNEPYHKTCPVLPEGPDNIK